MSYHIVNVDAPNCSLSCRDGQLVQRTPDGMERSVPLEDVAAIIITSFSATIHSHLFLEAAKLGVSLIICESFKPTSLLLPANRSTDTALSRAVLGLPKRTVEALWRKTVDAKCRNQLLLAERIAPESRELDLLRTNVEGRKIHKEAVCAKLFWQIWGKAINALPSNFEQTEVPFSRDRDQPGLNALLNYGYAVLLSTVLQKLFGVGLDPTYGIFHVTRERAAPLAYDLMEPFRPCVDWRVFQWVQANGTTEVTKEYRRWVTGFPLEKYEYLELDLEVQGIIEGVVRSFRRALLQNQVSLYRPWTPLASKWVG
ncbi:MAG: type II CRISPR-associated endonuclease Cas1 [Verrucomicrobiota bacterium]